VRATNLAKFEGQTLSLALSAGDLILMLHCQQLLLEGFDSFCGNATLLRLGQSVERRLDEIGAARFTQRLCQPPALRVLADELGLPFAGQETHLQELDLVVVYRYDLVPQLWPPGFRRTPLLAEPVKLLVPAGYPIPEQPLTLAQFAETSWISTREGSAGTLALERLCAAAGFAPRIRFVRSFVRAGFGVAAVPRLGFVGRIGLMSLDVTDLALRRHVEILTAADRHNPAVDAMIAALKAAAAALPAPD